MLFQAQTQAQAHFKFIMSVWAKLGFYFFFIFKISVNFK